MQTVAETVRVSQRARDQLVALKRTTKISQWNILSRWAIAVSLADPQPPSNIQGPTDGAVEMTWRVFGGADAEIYAALVRQRCIEDGLGVDPKVLAEQFRLHLHRGIGALFGSQTISSVTDLLGLAEEAAQSTSTPRPLSLGIPSRSVDEGSGV